MEVNLNLRSFTIEQLKGFYPNISILQAESFSDKQELVLPGNPEIKLYRGYDILYLDVLLYLKGTLTPYLISIYSEERKDKVKQLATELLRLLK